MRQVYCKKCGTKQTVGLGCKECQKIYRAMHKYGITQYQWHQMIEEQEDKCAICYKPWPVKNNMNQIFVDHDHFTGKVRGLLCNNCNSMIGFAKDDTSTLRGAITYLDRYYKKSKKMLKKRNVFNNLQMLKMANLKILNFKHENHGKL
jgi:hypothetical protein